MSFPTLEAYGWNADWAAHLAALDGDGRPARVLRHDGVALVVAAPEGVVPAMLARRLDPEPVVGDWVVLHGDHPVAVLPRRSLLRRRAAHTDTEHPLVANVDLVLLVCGLDRPVKVGRLQRGAALARDADAEPVVVLTKAAKVGGLRSVEVDQARATVRDAGLDRAVVTSVKEGLGVDELAALVAGTTVTLLGESGAGKSSIVNALVGRDAAETGRVRAGDAKGRHTTTTRELHVLPGGGVLIDTPGIRSVGLWVDPDAVTETFADIDDLAAGCRFADCAHRTEPGCLVTAAVDAGDLTADRVERWRAMADEAEALAAKAAPPRRTGRPPRDEPPEDRRRGPRKGRR